MSDPRDLTLTRDIAATPAQLYRCWTEPALICQWFCPPPWTVPRAETDVRPGGAILITMRGPDGQEVPNPGVYLEVVPNRRLVSTDAYTRAWDPADKPMMTLVLTFDDLGDGRTRYTAIARHRSAETAKTHADMGFHDGWGTVATQLEAYARGMMA